MELNFFFLFLSRKQDIQIRIVQEGADKITMFKGIRYMFRETTGKSAILWGCNYTRIKG